MYRIFRHYIPKTLLMLGLAEALILLVSVYLGFTLRILDWSGLAPAGAAYSDGGMLPKAAVFAFVMIAVMTAMGLYQRDLREGPLATLLRLGLSFGLGLALMAAVFAAFPGLFLGHGVFGVALGCAFIGIASCRFLAYQRTDNMLRRRILVIGAGEKARQIDGLRRSTDRRGIHIVGYLDMGNGERRVDGSKVLALRGTLQEMVAHYAVDEIVVALDDRRNGVPIDAILECKMRGVHVIEAATFHERQLGKIKLDALHPSNVVFSDGFSQAVLKSGTKRLFDIAVSALMLVVALPLMALTAIAILVESRGSGPIIYRQQRVGLRGDVFSVLKFRSMRVDAERDGARWAAANDDRVTRVGRIIRKLRIDELPQLWNVLKGDMSFVGPRPERPEFVGELAQALPYFALRHHVKPGITGWAQICYPYGASIEDAKEKLQYDLYYIKNYSVFLDLTILAQTVQVILWSKGSR